MSDQNNPQNKAVQENTSFNNQDKKGPKVPILPIPRSSNTESLIPEVTKTEFLEDIKIKNHHNFYRMNSNEKNMIIQNQHSSNPNNPQNLNQDVLNFKYGGNKPASSLLSKEINTKEN